MQRWKKGAGTKMHKCTINYRVNLKSKTGFTTLFTFYFPFFYEGGEKG